MKVTLLHNSPLEVADTAIGKCWDKPTPDGKPCNTDRIYRVGNKDKHASTLEHLSYTFDIDGVSRALLQELARHRIASYSVKSTRYTLKELKDADKVGVDYGGGEIEPLYDEVSKYCVMTQHEDVNIAIGLALYHLQELVQSNASNDVIKYALPEAYKTSLVWSINARSLQNFLALRTNKAALQEIRDLAYAVFNALPDDHKFLFEEFLYDGDKPKGTD